jgi:uncharacterized protein YkwD
MLPKLRFRATLAASLLALVVALSGTAGSAAAATCEGKDATPARQNLPTIKQATLCLINRERSRRGLPALDGDARLDRAAYAHSAEMALRNRFSHTSVSGRDLVDRLRSVGYVSRSVSWMAGENIGYVGGRGADPERMVAAWMASPGHRANILHRRFRDIGVGVVYGLPVPRRGLPGVTYTTDFGRRG